MGRLNETAVNLEFQDNRLLPLLFGDRDRYLHRLESLLNVSIQARGNYVHVGGDRDGVLLAETVLKKLYDRLLQGKVISIGEVDAAVRMAKPLADKPPRDTSPATPSDLSISTRRRVIQPRTPGQAEYLKALQSSDMVFAVGPAGTGKTYLATAMAISALLNGEVDRIILSRPAVEAGEKLGFLPGDLREKVDPYLRPLFDSLYDMLPSDQVERRLLTNEIEIAPLAFMRGRTLSRAFVILDEGQNTTVEQMKMFLTRLGEESRMVITGDLTQIDLPRGLKSGLIDALEVLQGVDDIRIFHLTDMDVLRHPLVGKIVRAYHKKEH